jgi:RimJ/RimL family protein N-acetyltransferase
MASLMQQLGQNDNLLPSSWPRPEKDCILQGKYCRLETYRPHHATGLYELVTVPDADERYKWLLTLPPAKDPQVHLEWITKLTSSNDPIVYVIIQQKTNKIVGRFNLMRITPEHGCIEVGGVLFGPQLSRSIEGTEAFFLLASYVFDTLHYRRCEWKCNNSNLASHNAAKRYGFNFEGVFRQHQVFKGMNRDTAWYSILDSEWPALKKSFELWLDESNFDANGKQIHDLRYFRSSSVI